MLRQSALTCCRPKGLTVPRCCTARCGHAPQGKRGLEKPPFKLPDFVEATGIAQMRQAYQVLLRPQATSRSRSHSHSYR